jgi:hypothetical protein
VARPANSTGLTARRCRPHDKRASERGKHHTQLSEARRLCNDSEHMGMQIYATKTQYPMRSEASNSQLSASLEGGRRRSASPAATVLDVTSGVSLFLSGRSSSSAASWSPIMHLMRRGVRARPHCASPCWRQGRGGAETCSRTRERTVEFGRSLLEPAAIQCKRLREGEARGADKQASSARAARGNSTTGDVDSLYRRRGFLLSPTQSCHRGRVECLRGMPSIASWNDEGVRAARDAASSRRSCVEPS